MVIDPVFNAFASSLNVNIADQYLLVIEARDGEDRRRRLDQRFSSQFNHGVTCARLGSTYEKRSYRRLDLLLLVLFFLIFIVDGLRFRNFLFLILIIFIPRWLDHWGFLRLGLWLQMGKLLDISIEVEQLRDSIRLSQG